MRKKILSVVLSAGLISGIGVVSTSSASAMIQIPSVPARPLPPMPPAGSSIQERVHDSWGNAAGKTFSGVGTGALTLQVIRALIACPICAMAGVI